ncbi:ATP-binding protein, partial [Chitinimonas sp.]|uniref:ATP-binding protein n=1 Tax=Chitinimonas sp. TaxID=1934313 RepID=UPI0035B22979
SSADQLLAIVNQILDFSKIEAGLVEAETIPYSLHQLVNDTVRVASMQAQLKGVEVSGYLSPDLGDMQSGDPTRLRQILTNLINNAIKFTEKGEVLVCAVPAAEPELIEFTVQDSGIGIPADRLAHIFEPFSQADTSTTRRFGGTGLGLAICKDLAELLGGSIWVESTPGMGSTFHFTIARQAHHRGQESQAGQDQHLISLQGAPLSILVVDDSEVNRQVAERMLKKQANWRVQTAESGFAALRLAEAHRFDIILMDLNMPGMGGLETTERLRVKEKEAGREPVPVVALTASAFDHVKGSCFAAGMNGFATKPIRQAELLAVIAEHVKSPGAMTQAAPDEPAKPREAVFLPQAILANLDGDVDFLLTLVRLYIDDTARRLSSLGPQLLAADYDHALQTAHAIKGGSGSIGATAIARCAETMERQLRAQNLHEARALLLPMDEMFHQLCQEVAEFLAEQPA